MRVTKFNLRHNRLRNWSLASAAVTPLVRAVHSRHRKILIQKEKKKKKRFRCDRELLCMRTLHPPPLSSAAVKAITPSLWIFNGPHSLVSSTSHLCRRMQQRPKSLYSNKAARDETRKRRRRRRLTRRFTSKYIDLTSLCPLTRCHVR